MPPPVRLDPTGRKQCTLCREAKPLDDFHVSTKATTGRASRCKTCTVSAVALNRRAHPERYRAYQMKQLAKPGVRERQVEKARERRLADPERARRGNRRTRLKKKFGITPEQYDAMVEAQGGLCAICGGPPVGSGDKLHIDHDHRAGHVRALLCTRCNVMIGYAQERIEVLEAAIAYLRRHSA